MDLRTPMNCLALPLLLLSLAPAFADERPPLHLPEITSYVADPAWDIHAGGGGCTSFAVPWRLAKVLENRSVSELLDAITSEADDANPTRMSRIADLTVIVLSGLKSDANGTMSDRERASGAMAYRIPNPLIRALHRGFPKDAAGWRDYYISVGRRIGG